MNTESVYSTAVLNQEIDMHCIELLEYNNVK